MLSINGDYAYGIPLNYYVHKNSIFFHCAQEGLKIELIEKDPKVSFCVVGTTQLVPDSFTTRTGTYSLISIEKITGKASPQLQSNNP